MKFKGYRRPDGKIGIRNHVLVLPCSLCASETARFIASQVWCYDYSKIGWREYLEEGREVTCYDSPILAEDLSGLPPVFSFIGTVDPLLDENVEYWNRLIRAGVPVEYHIFPGCYHSFEIAVPESHYAKMAYGLMYAALKRAFGME